MLTILILGSYWEINVISMLFVLLIISAYYRAFDENCDGMRIWERLRMMDGGIRWAGLGRKEATSNRHQVVHNSATLLKGRAALLQGRASGQMAGTGGKLGRSSSGQVGFSISYQHLHRHHQQSTSASPR